MRFAVKGSFVVVGLFLGVSFEGSGIIISLWESEALRSDDDAADDAQVLLVYGCQDCWIRK
jgi:hypothetical protein